MASDHVNIRITGPLREHLNQQVGGQGLYESVSEYIRDLIRRDLKDRQAAWDWLKDELEAGMRADDSAYVSVSAEDVIARNRQQAQDE